MYKNSLIVRLCMTEKPFTHKFAFSNVKSNFIFHSQFAHLLTKVISKKGIINIIDADKGTEINTVNVDELAIPPIPIDGYLLLIHVSP